jgi:hypothetical protein
MTEIFPNIMTANDVRLRTWMQTNPKCLLVVIHGRSAVLSLFDGGFISLNMQSNRKNLKRFCHPMLFSTIEQQFLLALCK